METAASAKPKVATMAEVNQALYGVQTPEQKAAADATMVERATLVQEISPSPLPAKVNQTTPTTPTTTETIKQEAVTKQVTENVDDSKTPKGTPSGTPTEDNKSIAALVTTEIPASTSTDSTQETEHADKSEATEAPKTIRISGKDYTEEQIMEAHKSSLRQDSYTKKMQALSNQEKANDARLREAGRIVDRDSVSKPFSDLITSNTEALTEMKEMLESKFGSKGIEAFNSMIQFDPKTFRHPLQDDLDKQKGINQQNSDEKALDQRLATVSESKNLTIAGSKQLDDFTIDEFVKTGVKLTYDQAYDIAVSRNISIESTTQTNPTIEVIQDGNVTQTLAQATTQAETTNPVTSPLLLTSTGSTPSATGAKTYARSVEGDLAFAKDNNIDLSSIGINVK